MGRLGKVIRLGRGAALIFVASLAVGRADLRGALEVSFEEDVFPILEERCFRCHSSEKQKGDLRLDSPEWILRGGESGDVLVPGEPDDSPMYYMTTYEKDDPDYMPSKGKGLSEAEQELLRAWISRGAEFGSEMGMAMMGDAAIGATPSSKYADERPLPPAKYSFSVSLIGYVQSLEQQGVIVDSVNHDADWFELTYTYAQTLDALSLSNLDPISGSVVKLNYGRSGVRDVDLLGVETLPALTYLDLRRTGVGDAGLANLAKAEALEYLNLFDTEVTDEGLRSLHSLRNLKQIYLHETQVSEKGVRQLQMALPELKVVW